MKHTGEYLYVLRANRPEMLSQRPTPDEQGVLEQHLEYLEDLADRGVVRLAGRTQNNDPSSFGIVIFRADSPEDARRIMAEDPAVAAGVMSGDLYPYRVAVTASGP